MVAGGLKNLSSKEIVAIFALFGFFVYGQKGSHIKLRRDGVNGKETLIIPERKKVPNGTLKAIFKQASAYVPQTELHKHFYNKNRNY